MIDICLPVLNQHEITQTCMNALIAKAVEPVHIILVDNGSDTPHLMPVIRSEDKFTYITHPRNMGHLNSLRDGLKYALTDTLIHQHNDVLVHEFAYDQRIKRAFAEDPKLGLMGYFGATGVGPDGARLRPMSNMVGQMWGTHGNLHGEMLTEMCPAVVFDSLAMIWRTETLKSIGIPEEYPPHHWIDRLLTLRAVSAGWRAATLGVAFDHYGSATYGPEYEKFTAFIRQWCLEHGLPGAAPDDEMYEYGYALFRNTYGAKLPLHVRSDYSLEWSA